MAKPIVGYEFELDFGDHTEWSMLHDHEHGGALGTALLYVQDGRKCKRIAKHLLIHARNELEREGTVCRFRLLRLNETFTIEHTIESVAPKAVLDCRLIRRT
jgi:hypothetical protein